LKNCNVVVDYRKCFFY